MSKKQPESSRFDALFGAVKAQPEEQPDTQQPSEVKHSDVQTSKSKDPDYQRTTIYIPKAMHRKLKAAAAEDGREMSEIVEELLKDWLELKTSKHLDV